MTSEPSGIPGEFEEEDWVLIHLNGVRMGREAERALIVAWLKNHDGFGAPWFGQAIENGEHLK